VPSAPFSNLINLEVDLERRMVKTETGSAPAAPFSHLIDLGVDLVRRMMGTNIRGVATAPLTTLMNLDVDLMRRAARIEPRVRQPIPITGGRRGEGESHRICWRRRTREGVVVLCSCCV
jgi:hypothetical protein